MSVRFIEKMRSLYDLTKVMVENRDSCKRNSCSGSQIIEIKSFLLLLLVAAWQICLVNLKF